LKTSSLETTDIFRGAFFLCSGGELAEVRIRSNGKRIATFLFTGAGLERLDKDYMNGKALVNPVQFRESLNRLRDILFETLRNDNPASHKCYAAASGRTRYDRKRKNRVHQNQR
jgi:hypothetical protein